MVQRFSDAGRTGKSIARDPAGTGRCCIGG
ncbi:hypothetical protein THITH_12580 [Thioalkalivibrio paradoxus ARh 1]|uniref:Uncharacterized protein n=1 Tax=Thioalkalivibrio paradoxus ARh 1 TaxID=713585 RepID=W0DTM9_9GAMM|nr:hypothetical protein THITH_12580 [Thioalkalivibrio paradoxus ARh 1]